MEIDLKPALDEPTLDKRLLSDFEKHINSDFINALGDLLPKKMIPTVVARSGIGEREQGPLGDPGAASRPCAAAQALFR